MKQLRFAGTHNPKLRMDVFPTIRLSDNMYYSNDAVQVIDSSVEPEEAIGRALVIEEKTRQLGEFPNSFILYDTDSESIKEAVKRLNQYWDEEITLNTVVTVYWIKWLEKYRV